MFLHLLLPTISWTFNFLCRFSSIPKFIVAILPLLCLLLLTSAYSHHQLIQGELCIRYIWDKNICDGTNCHLLFLRFYLAFYLMFVTSECSAIWRINHVQGLQQKITAGFEEDSGCSDHCIWSPTWWKHESKFMINNFLCYFIFQTDNSTFWFQSQPIEVNVVSHPIQRFAVWFGGSVLASTPEFYGVFLLVISNILVPVESWIAKGEMIEYWTSDW